MRRWLPMLVLVAACGQEYPSRDWSGSYLTRMIASSSDCHEAPVPPAMPEFIAELRQASDNSVMVYVNPIVRLSGSFEGDELEAGASMTDQLFLPDSLASRITPADSFDNVTYSLRTKIENWSFQAEYEIRAPDVKALVAGVRPIRCSIRYELAGARFEPPRLSEQPWIEGLRGDGAAPPAATTPADTEPTGEPAGPP
jgi:hypothetical protein